MALLRGTHAFVVSARWAAVAVLWACLSASAQPLPTPGFKIGDGRLSPYLDITGRFDSVVGFFSGSTAMPLATPDFAFAPRGGLRFNLNNDDSIVAINGWGEGHIQLGVFEAVSRNLTRFQAGLNLDVQLNKLGAVEFQLFDNLNRSDRTSNYVAGVGLQSLSNTVGLALPIHPGGRALEFTPSASWTVEVFDPLLVGTVVGCPAATDVTCNPALLSRMNYMNLNFGLGARWKFLPKTALVFDSGFQYRFYTNDPGQTSRPAGVFQARAGLVGLLTSRISLTLMAGYSGDWLGLNVHTFVANAEVAYIPSDAVRLALGYVRNVNPTPVFGVVGTDRGYLSARIALWNNRLTLNAGGGVDYLTFYNNANRNDLLISANAGPTVDLASWFQISAQYLLSTRAAFGPTYSGLTSVNFIRHEAVLTFTFRY
jgi:hypothetical protein